MFGKLFGRGKSSTPPVPPALLPFPADWTGYTSAAALLLLLPMYRQGAISASQRGLMVWELEKFAPSFCELSGYELLEKAMRFLRQELPLSRTYNTGELLPIAARHAGRLMQARGRDQMYAATVGALRVAADYSDHYDEEGCWLMLYAQYFAKPDTGARPWDAANKDTFYASSLPVEEQFAMIAAKHPAYQPVWSDSTFAAFKAMRFHERCFERIHTILRVFGDLHRQAERQPADLVLLLLAAAFALDTGNSAAADPFRQFILALFPNGTVIGLPYKEEQVLEAFRRYQQCNPDADPWVLLRVVEDAMGLLVDQPDSLLMELLLLINDILARIGLTAYRRELLTKAMMIWVYHKEAARVRVRHLPAYYAKAYTEQVAALYRPLDFSRPFVATHTFQYTFPSGTFGEIDVVCIQDSAGNAQVFGADDWQKRLWRWARNEQGHWRANHANADPDLLAIQEQLQFALLPKR